MDFELADTADKLVGTRLLTRNTATVRRTNELVCQSLTTSQ